MPHEPVTIGGYRLRERRGRGGTGEVYEASREGAQERVALKVLRKELCKDPGVVARFRREGKLLSLIRHPAIVPVLESGEDQGRYFLVMPLLSHPTLASRLEGLGPIHVPGARASLLVVAVSILTALEAIHQQGVIHRDLTPSNIFVTAAGLGLLADFGIVKVLGSESVLTRTGALLGTVPYMAPEQLEGQAVSPRTDLYQMGLVLYRMVAGQLPFGTGITEAVSAKCVQAELPDPREHGAVIPARLAAIIRRATSKAPSARFVSAAEMAAGLQIALPAAPPHS